MSLAPRIATLTAALGLSAFAAGPTLGAAIVYEPFADSESNLKTNATGDGLSGTWSTNNNDFTVNGGSLGYGPLATSGNQVAYSGGNGEAYATLDGSLAGAGLLDNGETLWFSVIMQTPVNGGSNPDTGFAIGDNRVRGTNAIPLAGTGTQGIGFSIKGDNLQASLWFPAVNRSSNAAGGEPVPRNTTLLIVGEIIWGDGNDTINLYLPSDVDLSLGSVVATNSGDVSQDSFTTVSFGNKSNTYGFDEIRFGATSDDVLPVPEPGSLALLGLGGLLIARRRRA